MEQVDNIFFEKELVGRKILVTGHSGFTGSWVCLWLQSIGVDVVGFSLPPETNPSLFDELNLSESVPSVGQIDQQKEIKFAANLDGPNESILKFDLHISNPQSPSELGQSDDPRRLGIGLINFEVD